MMSNYGEQLRQKLCARCPHYNRLIKGGHSMNRQTHLKDRKLSLFNAAGSIVIFLLVLSLSWTTSVRDASAHNALNPSGSNSSGTRTLGDLEIGDRVVDLTWEWEHRRGINYSDTNRFGVTLPPGAIKPVTWFVVAKDHYGSGSGVTLLAQEQIGLNIFDETSGTFDDPDYLNGVYDWPSVTGYNHWGKSGTGNIAFQKQYPRRVWKVNETRGLRPWLNSSDIHDGEGFYHAFSADFKAAVVPVTIPNRHWENGAAYTTQDRVFIPSTTELGDTEHDRTYVIGTVYPFFVDHNIPGLLWGHYWTRSPREYSSAWHHDGSDLAVGPGSPGSSPSFSSFTSAFGNRGVRPALNLQSATPVSATPIIENPFVPGVYVLFGETEETEETLFMEGKVVADAEGVFNWLGDVPLPYMPVEAVIKDENDRKIIEPINTVTDEEGKYQLFIEAGDLEKLREALIDEDEGDSNADIFPLEVELSIIYEYHRDDVNYFNIELKREHDQAGVVPALTLPVEVTGLEMEYDIDIRQWIVNEDTTCTTETIGIGTPVSNYIHFTPVYFHTHEAVEFALEKLNMGEELAGLTVEVGGNLGTHYDGDGYQGREGYVIRIDRSDLHFSSVHRPKNREYHEFGHHIMYVQYGDNWPRDWFRLGFYPKVTGDDFIPSGPGVEHAASLWQLQYWSDSYGWGTVWDSGEQWSNLNTMTFPAFNTDPEVSHYREPFADSEYHWRVQHLDSEGEWTAHARHALGDLLWDVNHDGYINPSSADSYIEGFAEFMALLMSKYRSHDPDPEPHIYANYGSMYNWWKPWGKEGRDEEFAVCGVLWKLYDLLPDLDLDEMWGILKVNRANFFEYYQAFNEAHPDLEIFIEAIFALHGFFGDQKLGDMQYNAGEARRSINSDFYFVDYGTPPDHDSPGMEYDYGDTVGQAANYERPWRYSAGQHPQSYLKVNDTQVRLYRVQVSFAGNQGEYVYQRGPGSQKVEFPPDQDYEYLTELRSGVLAIQLPPADTRATISIIPESRDYTAASVYSIDNQQAHAKLYQASQGFFDQHTFNLTPTGSNLDPEHVLIQGVEPEYRVSDLGRPGEEQDPGLEYTISVTASPASGGSVQGGGSFSHGQPVYVLATAAAGHVFQNWTENGGVVSSHPGLSFSAGADRHLQANFVPAPVKHTVTATAEAGGSVMPASRSVDHGDKVTFRSIPDPGYRHASVGGSCPAGSFRGQAYTTGAVTSDCDVIFRFRQDSPQDGQPLGNLQLGDRVVDRSWSWEHRTGPDEWDGLPYSGQGQSKAIHWIVVARDHYGPGSGLTLLAEDLIARYPFDTSSHIQLFGHSHWGQSGTHSSAEYGLRPWLNSTGKYAGQGFFAALPPDLQGAVMTTSLPNKDWEQGSAYTTQDKVFIPSATELGYTAHSYTYPIGQAYPYFSGSTDAGRRALLDSSPSWYWTRSPDREFSSYGAIVSSTGAVIYDFVDDSRVGVRPALNLAHQTLVSDLPDQSGNYELLGEAPSGQHVIAAAASPPEGGQVTGWGIYSPGSTVTLRATASPGWIFVHWTEAGQEVSASTEYSFTAGASRSLSAEFRRPALPGVMMLLLDEEE